jgi:metal-responsive CopG/Arc/MetJ family transcriptional regulator
MTKIISVSINDDVFKEFEEKRKESYPLLKRSTIIEQLMQQFNGNGVYFK